MFEVFKVYPVGFGANSYLLSADGKHAVCIDPAGEWVAEEAQRKGLKIEYVLLTHGHFDHVGGCARLQREGAKVGCLAEEKPLIFSQEFVAVARAMGGWIEPFAVDFTLTDGETFTLCAIDFTAIATPGHTAGGVCYLADGKLFTGDTLFEESIGRSDLPTGSGAALERSVKKLYALEGDYTVYAGHGEDTALEHERKYNWYVKA